MTLSATIVEKAKEVVLSVNEAAEGGLSLSEIELPPAVLAVAAAIGLIFCLFGWRLIRPINVIVDVVAGIFLGDMLADTMLASVVANMPWLRYVLMLVIGVVCGYITHKFFYVLLFLADFAGLAVGADFALMLFLPDNLSFVALIAGVLIALPISIVLFQLIIPGQIFLTDLVGSALVAGAATLFLSLAPMMTLIILGAAFLVGAIVQGRSAVIAKKNGIMKRFGKILARAGYNAGRVSDDFMDGFRKSYKTPRALR